MQQQSSLGSPGVRTEDTLKYNEMLTTTLAIDTLSERIRVLEGLVQQLSLKIDNGPAKSRTTKAATAQAAQTTQSGAGAIGAGTDGAGASAGINQFIPPQATPTIKFPTINVYYAQQYKTDQSFRDRYMTINVKNIIASDPAVIGAKTPQTRATAEARIAYSLLSKAKPPAEEAQVFATYKAEHTRLKEEAQAQAAAQVNAAGVTGVGTGIVNNLVRDEVNDA